MFAQMKNTLIFAVALLACASFSIAQPNTNDVIYGCTFEDLPACNIQLKPSGVFTWTWFSGSTPSLTTGPDADHTYQNASGHYMYTEASDIMPGQVATLNLPSLTTPQTASAMCLTFWWNMYGIHIGTLNVTQTTLQGVQTIWSLSGDQGYGWNQTNVTLQGGPGSSTVVSFIGVRGGDAIGQPYGDMAIDDVFVYEGSCFAEDTTTAQTTTTTTTPTTTTVPTTTPTTTTTVAPTTTVPTTTPTTTTTVASTTTVPTTTAAPTTTITVPPTTVSVITTVPTTVSPVQTTTASTSAASTTVTTPVAATTAETTTAAQSTPPATTAAPKVAAEQIAAQSTALPAITSTASPTSTITTVNTITTGASTLGAATSAATTGLVAATHAPTTTSVAAAITSAAPTSAPTKNINIVPVPQSGAGSNSTNCNNGVSGNPIPMLWGLTADKMIIILACLGAAILLLVILLVLVSCALCITRRRYIVKKSSEIHSDNTTLDSFDGISTINTSHAVQIDNNDRLPRDY